MVKNPPASAERCGDTGSVPGRRSPGEGNGNPLQYLCLGNLMDLCGGLQSSGLQRVRHDCTTENAHTHKR